MEDFMNKITEMVWHYGPKLIYAIVILVVGLWVAKMITKQFGKTLSKRDVDPSLRPFLTGIISALLKAMVLITVISTLGIEMTSFVAILGAMGLAVGMALSGTLQNFAGGVMILIFKPFKVGDFLEAQGHSGVVKEIQIFNTIMNTPDNKVIIIPNAPLSNGSMINYSREATRRVDMVFGVGYEDDLNKTRATLERLIAADSRILKDPAHFIGISTLADSSVNFTVRMWVDAADYWGVYFDMNESVKNAFDKEQISIPYPQTDVHLYRNDA